MLDKIKALLAKAASTDNPNEAEVFAAKANELMEKYQVDIDAIRASDDPVGRDCAYEGRLGGWRQTVASATARYFGCRAIITRCGKVAIFGRESARISTLAMFPYFKKCVLLLSRRMAEETGLDKRACAKQIGFEFAIRLKELAPAMEESTNTVVTGKNALIRLDEINAMVEAAFPNLGKARARSFRTSDTAKGYAASIGLASQMGGRGALQIGAR